MRTERTAVSLPRHENRVPEEFDRVARRYDLLTTLNPGYRKHLRWSAERLDVPREARLLDLCCGTGLSTEALLEVHPRARVVALDASAGMLDLAREKPALAGVDFVLGDAMDPRAAGIEGTFDGVLMAYGIRNVPDPDLCLTRIHDLLAPGGTAAFHEYSVAGSIRSQVVWNVVSHAVVLPLGLAFTGTSDLFRYLRTSVLAFDSVEDFEARLVRAGFVGVRTHPMDGWQRGIVHTFVARRGR